MMCENHALSPCIFFAQARLPDTRRAGRRGLFGTTSGSLQGDVVERETSSQITLVYFKKKSWLLLPQRDPYDMLQSWSLTTMLSACLADSPEWVAARVTLGVANSGRTKASRNGCQNARSSTNVTWWTWPCRKEQLSTVKPLLWSLCPSSSSLLNHLPSKKKALLTVAFFRPAQHLMQLGSSSSVSLNSQKKSRHMRTEKSSCCFFLMSMCWCSIAFLPVRKE